MASQASQIAQQTQASQQALQRAGGQQMITYYFNRDKDKGGTVENDDSIVPKKLEEKKKGNIDEDSLRGRFGWTTIHQNHIPYLFRREEKYCAVRMVELKLLNKYLINLPQEITTCINVRSYFITDNEARLLNEINTKHCECQFGRDYFTTKDLVVKVTEAAHFHRFLDTCYKKLVQRSHEQSEFCGFVRINGESVVPYTVKDKVKYVPLFYFEGETDTLKLKAEKIDNWELAYLKFCCKVQGIRNELFASDTCAVVSLDDVKQYFPKDTQFEDWWPQKTAEPMRVAAAQSNKQALGSWTQRPATQPPQSSVLNNNSQQQTNKNISSGRHQSVSNHHHLGKSSSSNLSQLGGLNNLVNATGRAAAGASAASHHASALASAAAGLPLTSTASAISAANYNLSGISNLNQVTSIYNQWASMVNGINGLSGINGINGINNSVAAAAAAAAAASAYNPSMQNLLTSLTPEQMRRLSVSVPNVSPHGNLSAAAAAVAAAAVQQQQHAASVARTLRSHSTSTTQASRQ